MHRGGGQWRTSPPPQRVVERSRRALGENVRHWPPPRRIVENAIRLVPSMTRRGGLVMTRTANHIISAWVNRQRETETL
jgi:hypothetical protein